MKCRNNFIAGAMLALLFSSCGPMDDVSANQCITKCAQAAKSVEKRCGVDHASESNEYYLCVNDAQQDGVMCHANCFVEL